MRLLAQLLLLISRGLRATGEVFYRLSRLAEGFLPVVLPPSHLIALVRDHYQRAYSKSPERCGEPFLTEWEGEVLDRYQIRSGRMLVMGCGWGREAIAVARRGVRVVGVDTSGAAVRMAQELARRVGVEARFHQGDYLELPYAPATFDTALLASMMFSAIPGTALRRAWLGNLRRLIKPNGLVILSFDAEREPISRLRTLITRLHMMLVRLPGANKTYQPGDGYDVPHFLHTFLDEDEIRRELLSAGATVRELDWAKGFAVLSFNHAGSSRRARHSHCHPNPTVFSMAGGHREVE